MNAFAGTQAQTNEGTIIGRYRIKQSIGDGYYGRVSLAENVQTLQKVALKQIYCPKDERRQTWQIVMAKEIQTMQRLKYHPNIVQLQDVVYVGQDCVCLILEYVEGGDLFSYLSENNQNLSDLEASKLMKQIVSAVQYCHAQRICHRDLKPDNILLDRKTMTVKLSDFGLSAFMPDDCIFSDSCGSSNYAAPEILNNQKYNGTAVDVWALGVTLFCLVTRHFPWEGETEREQRQNAKHGIFTLPDHVSQECGDLIRAMLTVDPKERITIGKILESSWLCRPNADDLAA